MAEITARGIEPTDLTGYQDELERVFRNALGEDLRLDPETPQGQLAGGLAISFAKLDELAVHIAAGLNLEQAMGQQLDDYGTTFSVRRIAGQRSRVVATLGGVPGTAIPPRVRVRTGSGDLFELETAVTIAASGTVDGTFRSVEIGAIPAPVDDLSILDVVTGWNTVTNANAATLGTGVEADYPYRRRYTNLVAVHTRDSLEAIRARILEVSGVRAAIVRDNPTDSAEAVQGINLLPGALIAVVQGGLDADVAAAIAATRSVGSPTVGSTSVAVPHRQGFTIPINFERVVLVPITVSVTVRTGPLFPSTGLGQIRENLVDWVAGNWNPAPGSGFFDTEGIRIGERLDTMRLLSPIHAVPGHAVTAISTTVKSGGGALPDPPNLNQRFSLAPADVSLTLAT